MKDFFSTDLAKLAIPNESDLVKILAGSSFGKFDVLAKQIAQIQKQQNVPMSFFGKSDFSKFAQTIQKSNGINALFSIQEKMKLYTGQTQSLNNLAKLTIERNPNSLSHQLAKVTSSLSGLKFNETIELIDYPEIDLEDIDYSELYDEHKEDINPIIEEINKISEEEIEEWVDEGVFVDNILLKLKSKITFGNKDTTTVLAIWSFIFAIVFFAASMGYSKYLSDSSTEKIVNQVKTSEKNILNKEADGQAIDSKLHMEEEKKLDEIEELSDEIKKEVEQSTDAIDEMKDVLDKVQGLVIELSKEVKNDTTK